MNIYALFDTNILILLLNDCLSEKDLQDLKESLQAGSAHISLITRTEVLAWPKHSKDSLIQAEALLQEFNAIELTEETATYAATLRRNHNLKLADSLIAANAVIAKLPIVTANPKDFIRVAELAVIEVNPI